MEYGRVEKTEGVGGVTLVDIERRNAMTAAMVDEIVATFDALESDGETAAVVVTGEPPAFCSGADVSSLGALARAKSDADRRSVTSIYEGFLRVLRSPLPTIAAVNGPAVAAPDDRSRERPCGRRGYEPRARVRRATGGNVGAIRHALREDRAASGRRPRMDARTRRRTAGGGRDGVVRGRRRRSTCGRDRARVVVSSRRRAARRGPHPRGARDPRPDGIARHRQGHPAPSALAARLRGCDLDRGHSTGVVPRTGLVRRRVTRAVTAARIRCS